MMATNNILQVGQEPSPMIAPRESMPAVKKTSKPKEKRSSLGRFECVNAFVDSTMATLGRAELAVWVLLWRDTQPDGLARTGQADIARRTGVSDRTVRRALRRLEGRGLVIVVQRGALQRGPSVYRVVPVERLPLGT
ncbi:MAG: helix-turn-helix domain-containing protein [Planctomycetota bacterium]